MARSAQDQRRTRCGAGGVISGQLERDPERTAAGILRTSGEGGQEKTGSVNRGRAETAGHVESDDAIRRELEGDGVIPPEPPVAGWTTATTARSAPGSVRSEANPCARATLWYPGTRGGRFRLDRSCW